MDDAIHDLLVKEFGEHYIDKIELDYECDLDTFIDEVFPSLMGESIDEYIYRHKKTNTDY